MRNLGWVGVRYVLTVVSDLAAGLWHEATDRVQQRGLAGTVRPDDRYDMVGVDRRLNVGQRPQTTKGNA